MFIAMLSLQDLEPSDRDPAPAGQPAPSARRFSLADVLTIIPKTKASQVELLVRTGKIAPAWPSAGRGHDRAFDVRNLFEISVAAQLMALGFVGDRLTRGFRDVIATMLDPTAPLSATYLVLLPSDEFLMPLPHLLSADDLEASVGIFEAVYVVNARRILAGLRIALEDFANRKAGE